jgi:hypothetical protein
MTIDEAIAEAEDILRGVATNSGDIDAQWKAIARIADFISRSRSHSAVYLQMGMQRSRIPTKRDCDVFTRTPLGGLFRNVLRKG